MTAPSAYKVTIFTSKTVDVDSKPTPENMTVRCSAILSLSKAKAFGQLVVLGFDVAVFTPAPYQRPRLGRPSMEFSSCGRLRT